MTVLVPHRRILKPRLSLPNINLARFRRLGDPSFGRIGVRGQPWGLGRSAAAAFLPSDLDNLVLWLRADTITGLSDGDPVATWNDDSGLGNDVAQGVAANRPTWETNELNGKPIVRFDGVNDYMFNAVAITQPFTEFVVVKADGALTGYEAFTDTNVAASGVCYFGYSGNDDIAHIAAGVASDRGAGPEDQWHIYEALFDTVSSIVGIDGTLTTGFNVGANDLDGVRVAVDRNAGFELGADIAELIIYEADIGAAPRDQVRTYLSDKYAIPIA